MQREHAGGKRKQRAACDARECEEDEQMIRDAMELEHEVEMARAKPGSALLQPARHAAAAAARGVPAPPVWADEDDDDVEARAALIQDWAGHATQHPQMGASAIAGNKRVVPTPRDEEKFRLEYGRRRVEWSSSDQPLVFMELDTDTDPFFGSNSGSGGASSPWQPLQMYGVTESGATVLCHIDGFRPYLFVQAPAHMANHQQLDLLALRAAFNAALEHSVTDVEIVRRRSIMFFVPGDPEVAFFKLTFRTHREMRNGMNTIRRGVSIGFPGLGVLPSQTFEGTVDFVMRFMVDIGAVGCGWIELPAHSYTVLRGSAKRSAMQIEVQIDAYRILAHKPSGRWLRAAPLRRLSFDIECAGRKGVFPEPEHDRVIQIANHVLEHGATEPVCKVIFTLGRCANVHGADVVCYETEEELLTAWSHFVRACDPDILTGYNIVNFDLPYLLRRAEVLQVSDFPYLGRILRARTRMRATKMSSSAFGTHESKEFSMDGRVILDMLQIVTREYKLRSYTLNSVSAEFLGEQKEDVHHSIISELQAGNEHTRRRLAVYCLKDAALPQRLMDRLLALTNYMEMARVTGVPLGWLVSKGHMIKVVSLLHRKAHGVRLLVPDIERQAQGGGEGGVQYEGATVIEPEKGFYTDPIATLDFASLYPSIMMAHNLCYSTLLQPRDVRALPEADVTRTPSGDCFVKASVKRGVLSEILHELLTARKQAKRDLAAEVDPFIKSMLNGRQLALKISANAVYGFTGATVGKLPCMAISASTTAFGRDMIQATKQQVEARYPGARVIYGDTDSVMVKFGGERNVDLTEAMRLGKEAAEAISQSFPPPVKLEFEKCYYPYLLINKKRYAGLLWTNAHKYDKMDCKGIESVRRDNCRLVANMISMVLHKLLIEKDVNAAVSFVQSTIGELLQNKVDLSLLVVSKALTKSEGKYDSKQAHVTLADKMRRRDAGTAPSLGDRVPYVIIRGTRGQAAYERAEDPLYAMQHNLPIDNAYYLENMIRKPLERIFEALLPDTSVLFSGAHTRKVVVTTPSTSTGILAFAKKTSTCLGCRAPIKGVTAAPGSSADLQPALCRSCAPKEAEHLLKQVAETRELEASFSSLWTECQRCMGELCQDVLCSNGDCPIFYRRHKVAKDLDAAAQRLARFQLEW